MATFDPTRILEMARVLNSGSTEEKLGVIEALDPKEAIDSGVMMRALEDPEASIRLAALERLASADVRPMDMALDPLLDDDDEAVRTLAMDLKDREETTNPLEELIPMVERMADSLGPVGGLLRSMIETLRGIGDHDEREQLRTVGRLDAANPASHVVLQQALRSPFISVRLSALRRVLELEHALVPESLISRFAADPSPEVRDAAEAVIRAGKVGTVDENTLRSSIMSSLIQSLGAGLGGLDLGAMLQGGNLDLGALIGGTGGLDLAAIFGGGNGDPGPKGEAVAMARPHSVDGWLYVVGDPSVRDRLVRSLGRLALDEMEPEYRRLDTPTGPARWAIEPVVHDVQHSPGWVETVAGAGLVMQEDWVSEAEQARFLSEQVWGAAYADHAGDVALTLVFHDGILSRAEWSGVESGAYAGDDRPIEATADGPAALLSTFLDDPTDDKLTTLGEGQPLFEA